MGARKRNRAEQIKLEKKQKSFAKLNNVPTSTRKMRLVADLIRGVDVNKALDMLKFSTKEPSKRLEKLLISAISNWQAKNDSTRLEDNKIFVKEVFVGQGRTLKRLSTAPQGRAYRVKKRSNHVTLVLGSVAKDEVQSK
jgi:large subunit ribosomal protein L22